MKIRLKIICIFMLIGIASADASVSRFGMSAEVFSATFYSQQRINMPMLAGYPTVIVRSPVLGILYNKTVRKNIQFNMQIKSAFPLQPNSNDGTGNNQLLLRSNSYCYRAELNSRLSFQLFEKNMFSGRHGLLTGFFYESRYLTFLGGSGESVRDINFYIGPGLDFSAKLNEGFSFRFVFDARFYIPYANTGRLQSFNDEKQVYFESNYHAFYYQNILSLTACFHEIGQRQIEIGIEKNDIAGFANRDPLFYPNDVIHYRLDRLFNLFFRFYFGGKK